MNRQDAKSAKWEKRLSTEDTEDTEENLIISSLCSLCPLCYVFLCARGVLAAFIDPLLSGEEVVACET